MDSKAESKADSDSKAESNKAESKAESRKSSRTTESKTESRTESGTTSTKSTGGDDSDDNTLHVVHDPSRQKSTIANSMDFKISDAWKRSPRGIEGRKRGYSGNDSHRMKLTDGSSSRESRTSSESWKRSRESRKRGYSGNDSSRMKLTDGSSSRESRTSSESLKHSRGDSRRRTDSGNGSNRLKLTDGSSSRESRTSSDSWKRSRGGTESRKRADSGLHKLVRRVSQGLSSPTSQTFSSSLSTSSSSHNDSRWSTPYYSSDEEGMGTHGIDIIYKTDGVDTDTESTERTPRSGKRTEGSSPRKDFFSKKESPISFRSRRERSPKEKTKDNILDSLVTIEIPDDNEEFSEASEVSYRRQSMELESGERGRKKGQMEIEKERANSKAKLISGKKKQDFAYNSGVKLLYSHDGSKKVSFTEFDIHEFIVLGEGFAYRANKGHKSCIIKIMDCEHTKQYSFWQHHLLMKTLYLWKENNKIYHVLEGIDGLVFSNIWRQKIRSAAGGDNPLQNMAYEIALISITSHLRFHVAELITIFDIIQKDCVYRSFKANDILLTRKGHICLSASWTPSTDLLFTSAQHSYLPPEIHASLEERAHLLKLSQQGDAEAEKKLQKLAENDHNAVWWSLGVFMVCLLTGKHPFETKKGVNFDQELNLNNPIFTSQCRDFLHKLLNKDPAKRLCGPQAVMQKHPFFMGFSWDVIKKDKGPIRPTKQDISIYNISKQQKYQRSIKCRTDTVIDNMSVSISNSHSIGFL
eukprot:TRINITY_DN2638_c0_g1_i1.p1 TRINITY_DN2638_c0_g1~~TRINITY_DN2638_c0_g1_i1.p1  ORF type:complete len:853 (+),score=113.40 TRINITY_DN2638_c0_g1_i1:305-2560(+)